MLLKLKIGRLGPLKENDIEFGDLTLLMGPPNTGKSYTLKLLYTKLFLLDEYASNIFKKLMAEHIESAILNEMRDTVRRAFGLVLKTAREQGKSREESDFEVAVETLEKGLSVTARRPISLNLSLDAVDRILKDSAYVVASGSLPQEYIESAVLDPVDISSARNRALPTALSLSELGFIDISIPPLNIAEHLAALIDEALQKQYEIQGDIDAKIGLEIKGMPSRDSLTISIVPTLWAELSKEVLDELKSSSGRVPKIVVDYRARLVSNKLVKRCSEEISDRLYYSLQTYIDESIDLDSVRFIPSAKSYAIMAIESTSHDPYTRATEIRALSELYPPILSSYIYWVSRGRGVLLSGKLTEEQKELIRIATPLLEGTLTADGSGRLIYRDWHGTPVDIRMASTLAREASGILLPLLTVGTKPLILIEEPEAQLHPRAQVIMALFTMALPKLCNCKIVASTHSDLFAVTIAQLAVQKPDKKWVAELIKEIVPHVDEGVNELAEVVAKVVKSIDVKMYEYTEEGTANQVQLEAILSERIPGVTEVLDKLINWSHNLWHQSL